MRTIFQAFVVVLLAPVLANCGGLIGAGVGAMGRAAGTGDSYSAWKGSMLPPSGGEGRLIVYKLARGGSMYAMDMVTGTVDDFLIDNEVCQVLGKTFMYKDLPVGPHYVSAGGIKETWSELSGHWRTGKSTIQVDISPSTIVYVRITNGVVQLIDKAPAEVDLKDLPLDNHFVSTKCRTVSVDKQ